ncbi:MAG: hypothetical protein ABII72_00855 [Parcubacteria group bacterium]
MNKKVAKIVFTIVWVILTLVMFRIVGHTLGTMANKNNTPQNIEAKYQELVAEGRNPVDAANNAVFGEFILAILLALLAALAVVSAGLPAWSWVEKKYPLGP